jgi:hypothetical protein
MIGSVGIDMQGARAAVCLVEWSGGQVRQGPVGDGRRILIPVAATATSWGSPAAEAVLGALPADCRLADSVFAWRQDAWSADFLAGLQRRLLGFLGQQQLARSRSHQVYICADPGSAADWATASELLDEAGLPGAEPVRPGDALLCRWLSETPEPPSGPVLAVACGEGVTIVNTYTVQAGHALAVRADGETRVDAGCGPWVAEVAAGALRLCRPGVPARALLSLLDGVDEFAAVLRARPGDLTVEWTGPLSQFMFEPVRASRRELASRPAVTDVTGPVADAVRTALSAVAGDATLLVGGPSAAWPFVPDALAGLGTVWQSGDPTLDLAYGACWWELYRLSFRRDRALPGEGPLPGPVVAPARVPLDSGARPEPPQDSVLPWEVTPAPPPAAPVRTAAPLAENDLPPWER